MSTTPIKKNIWVEKLTLIDVFYLFFRALFYGSKVYYDEKQNTSGAKVALNILKKIGFDKNFYAANLSFDKKDKFGNALIYQMEEGLKICLDRFCNKYIPDEETSFKEMIKSYIASYLYFRFCFILMVEHDSKFSCSNCENLLYLKKSHFNPIIISFLKENGYLVRESFLSLAIIKYYFRPFYLFLVILFSKLNFNNSKYNLNNIKPSIWVEYCHKARVDFVFWHKMINKEDFDVVYYLDRDDDPCVSVVVSEIEKQGIKCIYLHFKSLIKLANLKLREIKELMVVLCFGYPSLPLWFRFFKFEYKMWYLLYKSVYIHHKVKVLIQHQEVSWIQGPQKMAIESAGGIMVGFHWSSFTYCLDNCRLIPHHVYFVWGNLFFEWIKKGGDTCRYVLPSGLWITKNKQRQEDLDGFVKRHKFTIAIFDSSVGYNCHQSPDNLSKFYLRMLKLLEENSFWGAMIKNKHWYLDDLKFIPHGEEIISKINSLTKQNRIITLNRLVSPVVVASYADLSVCYSINSAGIIAATHGYRAVHCDSSGLRHHPFYRDEDQRVIFSDLEEFERAIIKASSGDKKIGDFSKWRKQFNYFDDFYGSERVGNFIQSFMEKRCDINIKDPLSLAVKEYIAKNKVGEDFFTINDYWERKDYD